MSKSMKTTLVDELLDEFALREADAEGGLHAIPLASERERHAITVVDQQGPFRVPGGMLDERIHDLPWVAPWVWQCEVRMHEPREAHRADLAA